MSETKQTREANARLIAAAPELLAALEAIIEISDDPKIDAIAYTAIDEATNGG